MFVNKDSVSLETSSLSSYNGGKFARGWKKDWVSGITCAVSYL